MKEGLFFENGELRYYKDGHPEHAGVVKIDGAIYYISSQGKAVKGQKNVHREMTNGILERGTYTFGEDCKLVEGSFIAPRKSKKSRKTKKKKSKRQKKVFSKKKNLVIWSAVLVIICLLVGALLMQRHHMEEETADVVNREDVVLPVFTEDVLLCSAAAKQAYDGELPLKTAVQAGDPYRPFLFQYRLVQESGVLYLSEQPDFSDAREYALPMDQTEIQIDNLKVNTDYFYKMLVAGEEFSGSFHTAASNRFVRIPGLVNTRDIGGYVTLDGRTVKQGVLIRGTEMDGLVEPSYYLADEDVEQVQETFGFVCDLDLREASIFAGEYVSKLGEDVTHQFYSAPMYGGIFSTYSQSVLREIFADLADPANYPMYLHCTYGADRTGTVVFLLQGILNVSEEDMLHEYGLTDASFADGDNLKPVMDVLDQYEGRTLQEQIVSFLTQDIGVTEAEIASIRQIFLS